MKFSLFIHMERVSPTDPEPRLYQEMLELCHIADEGGMCAIWTGEHHGMSFTIAPNPFLNLVDLARRTKNVRLGTGTVIAPFWHPIKLAGEAAMADIIMDGRLELGIARGAYSFEYERIMPGLDAWGAGGRMRELIPAIKGLWQGNYAHDGEFWKFPATTSAPLPLQQPHPPVWVAARDPSSHDFAVSQGCHVQVTPLHQPHEEVVSLMERFNAGCANHPDVPRPKIMILQHGFVARDRADADQAARELNAFYNYFGAWFLNKRPIDKGMIQPLSDEEIAAHPFYSPEVMRQNLLIGDKFEVIDRLKAIEALGYDEFSFWIDSGMSFARKREGLKRLIDDVMPAFA
ncbi:LLM class flavin-dependent oxidoreductase [Pseudogemmobacter humi]|uniref:Alkanal monooxygenase alpha chain n=1 Tax=Pseudogemmobacter humi TaxID=2483812 RepID=A0A3P5XF85_9RHOB|nr:LLM class flavin-dependent oxidoreductase [Pseudogemmobacter humi]VDC33473.1 Alkanal monooxygenase alpha chain [Pseudogemmobacter humi]